MNTATAGYTATQRTMAREGLEVHDAGCCTTDARCWMAEGLERIANSTRSTVVMSAEKDAPLPRGNGAGTGRGRVSDTATDKQMSWIKAMIAELDDAPADFPGTIARDMVRAELATGNPMTKRTASGVIDKLKGAVDIFRAWKKAQPKPERATRTDHTTTAPVTEGMYEFDGSVYRVKMSGAGRLYAMLLVITDGEGSFEMSHGTIRKLRPEHRMTLERASELSIQYHFCVRCATELTRESSIARGLGPDCAAAM